MEKEYFWSFIIMVSILALFIYFNYCSIQDLENKINGNCIYVNNEFYCKD